MSDKIDLIHDIVKSEREESAEFRKEMRDANRKLDEKLTKIEIESNDRLSKIEALDNIQNKQLEDHIRRTEILEELHKDNEKRIEALEAPGTALSLIGSWIGWASVVGGTVYGLLKFLNLI